VFTTEASFFLFFAACNLARYADLSAVAGAFVIATGLVMGLIAGLATVVLSGEPCAGVALALTGWLFS
jgi:hypothetical protein